MERPTGGKRGPKSEAAEYLRSRVKGQPDRTLAELQEDLRRHQSIGIGITQLCVVLKRMGLRLKEVTPRRRVGQRASPGATPVLAAGSPTNRSGATHLRGRERRHHGNDALSGLSGFFLKLSSFQLVFGTRKAS